MTKTLKLIAAAVLMAAGLSACEKQILAPDEKGVCWHVIPQKDGTLKFNKLASNVENMETCAATLEGMRDAPPLVNAEWNSHRNEPHQRGSLA